MKVTLNCGPKQALSTNKSGMVLFRGDAKPATKAPEVKDQPSEDKFVKSEKPAAEPKAEAKTPAKKAPAKQAPAKEASTPEAPAKEAKPKCEGPNCDKNCK